jgi:hypothetical protein
MIDTGRWITMMMGLRTMWGGEDMVDRSRAYSGRGYRRALF